MVDSAREEDSNGFITVTGNPISKVGVFAYSGAQIDDKLEPTKMYMVFRPPEELSDPACIESFKLQPWIDEHVMLGHREKDSAFTPPEDKGIEGVTGQDVYFEDGYLKANLRIFSQNLKELVKKGKKELSIGYHCVYDLVQGVYQGVKYDAVQRKIRGNHLATIHEGRSGPDIAVLDHFKFTVDSAEFTSMIESVEKPIENMAAKEGDMAALMERFEKLEKAVAQLIKTESEDTEQETVVDADMADPDMVAEEDGNVMDADKEVEQKVDTAVAEKKEGEQKEGEAIKKLAADMAEFKRNGTRILLKEISKRDALAKDLFPAVGTFDHSGKTLDEVAKYGVAKLKLNCPKGHEIAALDGYFKGATANPQNKQTAVADSKTGIEADQIKSFLSGE